MVLLFPMRNIAKMASMLSVVIALASCSTAKETEVENVQTTLVETTLDIPTETTGTDVATTEPGATDSSEMGDMYIYVETTAKSVARDAEALAMFNSGEEAGQVTDANIDGAAEIVAETEGWAFDASYPNGAEVSFSKDGESLVFCIKVGGESSRAEVSEGSCS